MKRSRHTISRTFLLAWLLWLLPAEGLVGQVVPRNRPGEEPVDIFLPAPRSLRQQLSRANKALEQEQLSEAVDLLGQLLADTEDAAEGAEAGVEQDFFLPESEAGGTQTSLKSEAQRMLGAMPDKGRELYELKFGADARQMLDRALETRDLGLLVEVTRRYFHTLAGYEATLLLGRYYLDQGRPLAAAMRFERLVASPHAARAYEPELSVLLATCWLMAGRSDRAQDTLVRLKTITPQATLRIGDQEVSLFQDADAAVAWLERLIGPLQRRGETEATEWAMFRGNEARNAESRGGFPLLTARWRVMAVNHPSDEELIRQQHEKFREEGIPALPTLQPLAVADVALVRTPRQLMAVDMGTGKRIWEFPWSEETNEGLAPTDRFQPDMRGLDPYAYDLNQRMWNDAPYGQMSSDGQQVFLLWRLASDLQPLSARVLPFGRQRGEGTSETNKLVALDLRTEGKLRWIVGDEDGTDEPKLAGAFFLGPPLPLMGHLYALAEMNSEIRLVVLDAENGQLVWAQQLAHVDQREIAADPGRRAAGASPSFSDGVLVCPTSAGAVVAVDIATRSLLWGYRYGQTAAPRGTGFNAYPSQVQQTGQRWVDATVTLADGLVLATPVESDQLHCLDLLTGKPRWDPQPRNGMLYVACVTDGQAVLVGADRLQAVSLDSGAATWTTPLPSGAPTGRGLVSGDAYYLPTTGRRLLKINMADGAVAGEVRTDLELGNLVAYRDQIISQNVDWLSAYYQTEPLRDVVAGRLRENPDDVWALMRRADLLLYDGVQGEALAVLRRAHQLAPQDDAVRTAFVRALMTALETEFESHREFAGELESLIDQPAQLAEFYRLMAIGLRKSGTLDQSVDFFLKLASLDTSPPASGSQVERPELVRVDAQWQVRRDRWIAVNLGEILAQADGPLRERIDATVAERMQNMVRSKSVPALRQFVNYFGHHPQVALVRLQLARVLLERNEALDAELELIQLQESPEPAVAAQATAWLANLLRVSGHMSEAARCYERLARQWPDVPVRDGQTGRAVAEAALAEPTLQQALAPVAWPRGEVTAVAEARGTFQSSQSNFAINLIDVNGPFPTDASLVYNRQVNAIMLRDATGSPLTQVSIGDVNHVTLPNVNAPAGAAAAEGHLIIACVGSDVLAIDALRKSAGQNDASPVRWPKDLSSSLVGQGVAPLSASAITRRWGPTRYVFAENLRPVGSIGPITTAGFFYQKAQELVCAEPLTGETIWTRGGVDAGSDIFGDDAYVFVAAPNQEDALILRAADGAELGRRFVGSRQSRWVTAGRFVLHCQEQDERLVIRWFDAATGKDVWRRDFAMGAQCALVGRDAVAVLEVSGQFTLVNLADGAERFGTSLEAEPELARLYVIPSRDAYLVLVSRAAEPDDASVARYRPWTPLGSDLCPEINGRIYALDNRTGQNQWPAAAEVARLCCPLDQPLDAPALVFFQNVQPATAADSPRPAIRGAMLAMDKRDGRQLLFDDDLAMIRTYAITAQPEARTLTVSSNSKQVVLTFTEKPVEQQPPLKFTAPPPRASAMDHVGKVARGILQVIAKPKQSAPEQPRKPASAPQKPGKPASAPESPPAVEPEAKKE